MINGHSNVGKNKDSKRRAIASVKTELELHMTPKQPLSPDRNAAGLNDIIDINPNVFGVGVNFNALFKKLLEQNVISRKTGGE